jgi:uncharacterized protein with von Willebrand factor type A (vWA) domain
MIDVSKCAFGVVKVDGTCVVEEYKGQPNEQAVLADLKWRRKQPKNKWVVLLIDGKPTAVRPGDDDLCEAWPDIAKSKKAK